MFKLKSVRIEGFWGENVIETNFYQDSSIFIGRNGTGKTTFINILQAIISVDIELLYNLQFEKVILNLEHNKLKRKIEVSKIAENLEFRVLKYKIGTKIFELPMIASSEIRYSSERQGRLHPKYFKNIRNIKEELQGLIRLSYLSVYREQIIKNDPFSDQDRENRGNTIDIKLTQLMNSLTKFQFQLETELSSLSKSFQENVLKSMLYNPDFDQVDISKTINLNLRATNIGLKQAYRGLGILDPETSDIVDEHVKAILKATEAINNHVKDTSKPLYPNDVTPLTLLRRTEKIIELSTNLEDRKKEIFKPINSYLELLNEYHDTKEFSFDEGGKGGLIITKKGSPIPISQLSSGEKQLIIILTETLIQRETPTVFIADEPELSLHIEWQRKIVPSIGKLNPNAQIIIATHSPEIVGKLKKNTINMEEIIYE
jgi:predicted ATP-dependent endonuclease of OLD family